jgi:hypothetical protein
LSFSLQEPLAVRRFALAEMIKIKAALFAEDLFSAVRTTGYSLRPCIRHLPKRECLPNLAQVEFNGLRVIR